MGASGPAATFAQAGEEVRNAVDPFDRHLGPCPPDSPERVGVAAANHGTRRRAVPSHRDLLDEQVVVGKHGAVSRFDAGHLVEQLEIRGERKLPPVEVEQVIEHEEDAGLAQPGHDFEDVAAKRLQLAVQLLVHPIDAEVDFDVSLRQPAGHFLGDEEVAGVGMAVEIFEAAANRVVVGDRHEVHSARLGNPVHVLGT